MSEYIQVKSKRNVSFIRRLGFWLVLIMPTVLLLEIAIHVAMPETTMIQKMLICVTYGIAVESAFGNWIDKNL